MAIKLVMLPGMGGSGDMFLPLIKALPAKFEPVVLPLPQSGPTSLEDYADALVRDLPIEEPFFLLAESFSGLIASHIAAKPLPHLLGVIMFASYGRPPRPFLSRLLSLVPAQLILAFARMDWVIRRWLVGSEITPRRMRLVKDTLSKLDPQLIRRRLRLAAEAEAPRGRIQVPCIQVTALDDRIIGPDHHSDFEATFPRLLKFKMTGPHFLLQTKPEFCARLIDTEVQNLGYELD